MNKRDFLTGTISFFSGSALGQVSRPTLGFLGSSSAASFQRLVLAFHEGMNKGGFREGLNLTIIYRWGEDNPFLLQSMAEDLVKHRVTAIAATGGTVSLAAAQRATSEIPIIFTGVTEPVKNGFVSSFNRPGGNTTGVSGLTGELDLKRLELLHQLVPAANPLAVVMNPNRPDSARRQAAILKFERSTQRIVLFRGGDDAEIEEALRIASTSGIKAILFWADPLFNSRRHFIVNLLKRYRIPAMFALREIVEAGGLASYGTNMLQIYREAGRYTARVLHGEHPSELPISVPNKFEFLINRSAANDLGLVLPPGIIIQADEVLG